MRRIFSIIVAIFVATSLIVPYFSVYAIDYEKLLEEAQNRRRELIEARLEADANAAGARDFEYKRPYTQEAEKINKELKIVMDKIALYKKAVANFDEVFDAGQSVANLGYSRKPYKGKIEDLERQIAKNQKDISDLEARLKTSPNDPTLKRAYEDLKEETFQLKESLREAKSILKNLNKEMRDKTDPARLARMKAENESFDRSKELQTQLEDAKSELKKARLKGDDTETVEGLRKFIQDTQADIDRPLMKLNRQQIQEERAALPSEAASKIREAREKRTGLFREAISPEQVAKRMAERKLPKKVGWFGKLLRGRSNVVMGLPLPDPLFDVAAFYLAQKAANKCHQVVIGEMKVSDEEMRKCVKLLLDQENRRISSEFSGLDPLKQPGGDLFEVPEGYYKNWLGFYIRTPEKVEQDKRREELLRMN